jgi:CubicO group peptidase (beta-lactamase class C family)
MGGCAFAADDAAAKIDKVVRAYYDAGLFNGTVLVADHGKVIYEKALGYANFEWQVPNTIDTKFRIGSVTKTFTAVLVMQQVEVGKITLDAPIIDYLPEYRKDTGSRVTVRHLLTHTSGIPSYGGHQIVDMKSVIPQAEFTKKYCSGDPTSEPGARWSYNNCGYFLLGTILERVTSKTYAQHLQENIAVPAGMADTGIDSSQKLLPKRAYGYETNYVNGLQTSVYSEISTALGAGDIYSTVDDLYKFDRALYSDKLLSTETRKLMFTPQNERTGLGWFIRKAPPEHPAAGDTLQFHEGHIFGFFTMYTRIPEREALVVTNDNTDLDTYEGIHREIFNILYHGTYTLPKKPIARKVASILCTKGANAAVARYKELKSTTSEYDFSDWRPLNRVGYAFLNAGRMKDAVAIFQLNAEQFPERWEVWDSLAESQMNDGQTAQAIANYDKSLKLNPKNDDGAAMLKKLRAAAAK